MAKIHNFDSMLKQSNSGVNDHIFDNAYNYFFSDIQSINRHRADGPHQRGGRDASIIFNNSNVVYVDEKMREQDWGDIALEYLSDTDKKTPGWVCKPLLCDYIAYGIKPSKNCFLLPVIQLQQAFQLNQKEWLSTYPICRAKNKGYITSSVAVPINVLYPAIGKQFRYYKPL